MLLLTVHEWFGPARHRDAKLGEMQSETRQRAFATRLPLGKALARIRTYENSYNERYANATALAFELISVAQIADLSDEEIDLARVVHVEKLDRSADEIRERYAWRHPGAEE